MMCEICNSKQDKTCICMSCDTRFCEKCGDFKREMCEFCIGYNESQADYSAEYEED